jgi:hypothetical protein
VKDKVFGKISAESSQLHFVVALFNRTLSNLPYNWEIMRSKNLIIPAISGLTAQIVLAVLVVTIHRNFEFNIIRIWVGPVPFVSGFSSFLASFCFLIGLDQNKMNESDDIHLAVFALLSSVAGIFLIYYLEYQTAQFSGGQMISQILTFKDFLQASFSPSSIKMVHQDANEALQLGQAGFLLPAMEGLAYIIGGSWIGFAALRS